MKTKLKDNRTESISFRVTPKERMKLEQEAREKHCSTSQLICQKLFHKAAVSTGSGKGLLPAIYSARTELKRLADFCLSHPADAMIGPILASAGASLSFIQAYINPKNYLYYYPDTKRDLFSATVVTKADIKTTKKGLDIIILSVNVDGEEGVIEVCSPYPIHPALLTKGRAVVIIGFKKNNLLYADAIFLRKT